MESRPPLPMLLTADDVAELLRTTRRAIYTMHARGEIPGVVRLGSRRLLFDRDTLLGWLHESRESSPERQQGR